MSESRKDITQVLEVAGLVPCVRCREPFGDGDNCASCGVAIDRPVRRHRTRKIGGKRGRNSGKVSQHGKKG